MWHNLVETDFAQIHLLTDGECLVGLFFNSGKHKTMLSNIKYDVAQGRSEFVRDVSCQLQEYFVGRRNKLEVPYKFLSGTEFQRKVWCILENIPYGSTKTYKQISEEIGNPKAVRAVANAVGKNALSIIVPCHRVIGLDGKLHGYAGGVSMKERLLEVEGVL